MRHNNFYQRIFCPALARAGLPAQVRFHDLRHTCAALLIAQGAHPKAIQVHLGHSSIQMTMDRYGTCSPTPWSSSPTAWTRLGRRLGRTQHGPSRRLQW